MREIDSISIEQALQRWWLADPAETWKQMRMSTASTEGLVVQQWKAGKC